jgi:hypothetical protein
VLDFHLLLREAADEIAVEYNELLLLRVRIIELGVTGALFAGGLGPWALLGAGG